MILVDGKELVKESGWRKRSADDEDPAHPRSSILAACQGTYRVTDVHRNYSSICARSRYSAPMCMTPMQARMSMLV